jgi:hypothetical protein
MIFPTPFGPLTFLSPWILAGLALLPVLYYLLQITPPAPKRIFFPATRFLAGLTPETTTSDKTPWWILLLRMMIVALVLLALSQPVLNPQSGLSGNHNVRIIMDNGWEAQQSWTLQQRKAREIIGKIDGQDSREIFILTTAPEAGKDKPASHGPLSAAQALTIIKAITPQPWPADYEAAQSLIEDDGKMNNFWLASGMMEGHSSRTSETLMKFLNKNGTLEIFQPELHERPIMMRMVIFPRRLN